MGHDERMERLVDDVDWPEPREDLEEEPTEPWAKRDPDGREWPWRDEP